MAGNLIFIFLLMELTPKKNGLFDSSNNPISIGGHHLRWWPPIEIGSLAIFFMARIPIPEHVFLISVFFHALFRAIFDCSKGSKGKRPVNSRLGQLKKRRLRSINRIKAYIFLIGFYPSARFILRESKIRAIKKKDVYVFFFNCPIFF